MKVTIDIRLLLKGGFSGVEEYTRHLTSHLIKNQDINWNLFYNTHRTPPKLPDSWHQDNVSITNLKLPNKLLDLSGKLIGFPHIDTLTQSDCIISPHLNFISYNHKRILVIHDLSFLHYPKFFSWQDKLWLKMQDPINQIRQADFIVADSEFTKSDIIHFAKIKENKVHVIYPGLSPEFNNKVNDENFNQEYNLPNPYILYLGSFEPRKNVPAVIKAFNLIKKESSFENLSLVLAGSKKWLDRDINQSIQNSPYKNNIKIISNIVSKDRQILYNKAKVFIYPSFFEGFGFPPLEAQASGTPVIASNRTSLPEILEDSALLIDPWSIEDIYLNIKKILKNQTLESELINKGLENVKRFSWPKTSNQFINLLNKI